MQYHRPVAFLAFIIAVVSSQPSNNWNQPCFDGEGAYDLQDGGDSGYGSIKIFGSPKSVSDITAAAGWVVLDCDKNSLEQEIRLVCRGDSEASCNHLLEHGDPANKLIRLPEDCGAGPFARVASFGPAEDQSLPAHVEV
ncbi:hypothetical protein CCMSSC00406_0006008 [Pleurotus cornucopiae]|uniref:Uncharacterized protein n=1 Tax=Pleurotus cornucopiae TaxID=5321 RepID=A0ACB7INZ5_PLECO|nr:hypothetical protein CCMSSC00406_0006008 [Pleurotus cornucopiae]